MSLGGRLIFNKQGSMYIPDQSIGHRGGTKHDENNDVDFKISDKFIKNGEDNFFPFDIEQSVKRSMVQKRAHKTISSLVNGSFLFINDDKLAVDLNRQKELLLLYSNIGIDKNRFLGPVSSSNYLQGGSFVTNQFESNGRAFELSRVIARPYKTGRLSAPEWGDFTQIHPQHFYHRNWGYNYGKGRSRKPSVSARTMNWIDWNKDPKKNFDAVCWIPEYNTDLSLSTPVNRMQSSLIGDFDGLSDYYPIPSWFTATTYNYMRSEFFLSCFDVDDIENGLHASGIMKVYHKDYIDQTTGQAKRTFERQRKEIEEKMRGSKNSGSIAIIPVAVGIDGKIQPGSDFMEFEAIDNNNVKDRHDTFDKRIMQKILGANSVVMSELLGIRDEKSTLSESGTKLLTAAKLLIQFVVKPQKEIIENYLNNKINPLLGISEKVVITPNASAFANLAPDIMKHYLHPDHFYEMYGDFGIPKPTIEQISSNLIPAYNVQNSGKKITIE
jgi:hypothetical protein